MTQTTPIRRTFVAIASPLGWVAGFSCFLNLIYLAAPLYMMQVYDRVMHSRSVPTLLYLTLAVAICYVVYAVLDGVRGRVLAGVGSRVDDRLAGVARHRVHVGWCGTGEGGSERGRSRG